LSASFNWPSNGMHVGRSMPDEPESDSYSGRTVTHDGINHAANRTF
jgi:hypothetical protein